MRTPRLAVVLLALCVLLPAETAFAEFAIDPFAVAPSPPAAGSNTAVKFSIGFPDTAFDVQNVRLDLAPGLIGNPLSTDTRCTSDQFQSGDCPASTVVGAASVTAELLGMDTLAEGSIFNLEPQPNEPARLGIENVAAGGITIRLQSPISVRPEDGGLTSTLTDIPNTAGPLPITIKSIDFTLNATAPNGKGFTRNPTSCAEAVTRVSATAYGGAPAAAQAAYTPSGCDAQSFSPVLSASVGGPGFNGRGSLPPLRSLIVQPDGQADLAETSVALPDHLDVNGAGLTTFCTPDQVALRTCPPQSVVGSAVAQTPVLAEPLEGPVVAVKGPTDPLPGLAALLSGRIPLTVRANVGFAAGGRILSTFTGLPDVPVSRFELSFNGGEGGMLLNSADLCVTPTTLAANFKAHSGQTLTQKVTAVPVGCRPRASLRLKGLRGRRPALSARLAAPPTFALGSAQITLPRGLSINRRKARRGLVVRVGKRRVSRRERQGPPHRGEERARGAVERDLDLGGQGRAEGIGEGAPHGFPQALAAPALRRPDHGREQRPHDAGAAGARPSLALQYPPGSSTRRKGEAWPRFSPVSRA